MATYIRLTNYKSSTEKEQEFFNPENRYEAKQEDFSKIPASPIAYWVSDRIKNIFTIGIPFKAYADTRVGLITGDNEHYIRDWQEISFHKIGLNYSRVEAKESQLKWFPQSKGGDYRKWYGNNQTVVNWFNDGYELQTTLHSSGKRTLAHNFNLDKIFEEAISWTKISSGSFSARLQDKGFLFNDASANAFLFDNNKLELLAFLGTKIPKKLLSIISQTLNFLPGDIGKLPIFPTIFDTVKITPLAKQNIEISKEEWNSRESSWDFTKNELLKHKSGTKIETAFSNYCEYWSEKFVTLHKNEEELNRLFIDIYELQDELDEYVEFKDITILKNEAKVLDILIPAHTINEAEEGSKTPEGYMYYRGAQLEFQADEIMKQFISYGVGVMFGRYSLDSDGLLIANMGQEVPTSITYEIDDDNVIPVLEDEYFNDDIAARFVEFVKVAFGEESLSENINFIEECLGKNIRKYFVKDFYEDHIKRYKKRPIYWMVSSPKKSFNALLYMHRYESDIFARVQNAYLREYITKLEATKQTQTKVANDESNSTTERREATRDVDDITKKLDEIIKYDRDNLTIFAQNGQDIDLDDGVKVNYCKFEDILYPIKGLCKK